MFTVISVQRGVFLFRLAFSFSNSPPTAKVSVLGVVVVCVCVLNCVRIFATPLSVAHQAPLFMGLSWQEYWNGLPVPSPGDLPDPGIKPGSPAFQTDALTSEKPGKCKQVSIAELIPHYIAKTNTAYP